MEWALQDAKNRFSEVVRSAVTEGPQTVTVRGQRTAVVVSAQDYDAMKGTRANFIEDLLAGPEWDDDFHDVVNSRSKDPGRDVDL